MRFGTRAGCLLAPSVVALTAVALTGGCGGTEDYVPTVTRYDSAGITMVEIDGIPEPAGIFQGEMVFEHGLRPGDYEFQSVFIGALRPGGGAVISDSGNREVVEIGPAGTSHQVLASFGRGPSEVTQARSLQAFGGDSLWIEDDGNTKVMLFVGADFVRSIAMPPDQSVLMASVAGRDSTGDFLMLTSGYMPGFEQPWLPGYLTRYEANSGAIDTLASYDFVPRAPPNDWNPFPPIGHAVLSAGELVTFRSDIPEIRWQALTGEPRVVLRWNPVGRYPTEEDWETFRASLRPELRRVNPGASEAEVDRMVERNVSRYSLDPSEPLPLFATMHGDDVGRAWLGEHVSSPRIPPSQYDMIDSEGTWLGKVQFPHGVRVLDIRDDHVLTAFMDDMDVTAVAIYRVRFLDG